jgi:hypothetical protein
MTGNNIKINDENDFDRTRTILTYETYENDRKVNYFKQLVGLIIYFVIFVLIIPHFLIKYELYEILTAYIPNLDMIATIIGYKGGPYDIWKYLYNPSTKTIYGYLSSTFINYLALLGVTYIVAYNTYIKRSINNGWSLGFFMLIITYLLPGNILALIINKFGLMIDNITNSNIITWFIVVFVGIISAISIILIESKLIHYYNPILVKLLSRVAKNYNIKYT